MKQTTNHRAGIAFAVALTQIISCSKTPVNVDRDNAQQTQPQQTQPQQTQPQMVVQNAPGPQNTIDRIVEIDRLLAAPLTGTPEDSDRRAVLRAERATLAGPGNHASGNNHSSEELQKAQMEAQASRDWQHTIDQMKSDAERSKIAEQKRLQAQRDQWAKNIESNNVG